MKIYQKKKKNELENVSRGGLYHVKLLSVNTIGPVQSLHEMAIFKKLIIINKATHFYKNHEKGCISNI